MTPMQPFQFDQAAYVQSTPQPRKELPARIKVILGFKVVGCLLAMGISLIVMLAFSDPANRPVGMSTDAVHKLANLAMLATGASLVELLGVAGTWSFKRWGVYLLTGFSMMSFVLRVHSGDALGAAISIASTLITGLVIATRWSDFE